MAALRKCQSERSPKAAKIFSAAIFEINGAEINGAEINGAGCKPAEPLVLHRAVIIVFKSS
jgi:hypothetical protein